MDQNNQVYDLRSALNLLRSQPGQLVETDVPVDPSAELAGVYRHVGAGGTVQRPTREGPAMLFIRSRPSRRSGRHRRPGQPEPGGRPAGAEAGGAGSCPARLCQPPHPARDLRGGSPCQQVVHRADDPDFDLRALVPAPTNTPDDAGPYITLGMCYATHPDTGVNDITIHRLCIQGRDELSIFFTPGARHIGAMAERAEQLGRPCPSR